MSNQFIGLTMLVTLSSPPGAQLRGVVNSIEPGKSLTLRNVTCPANGKYVPEFTINAAEITELVEAVNENVMPAPARVAPAPTPVFEDPAILSMGKRPTPGSTASARPSIPGNWTSGQSMERTESSRTLRDQRALNDITPAATLVEPLEHVSLAEIEGSEVPEAKEESAALPIKTKRTRRQRGQRRDKKEKDGAGAKEAGAGTGTGWRQTPLLEPVANFQPFSTLKKKKGRRVDENGWATEDATDVQDMGDFDFAGSLAKFDKHSVFNAIQAEDSVAEADRLVSHNRLPKAKPGTAGGKNLHYSENVLDGTANGKDNWKSEAGDSDEGERASQRGSGSGRLSRRAERAERAESKMSRRPTSRKGSSNMNAPARSLSIANPSKPSFYLMPSDRRCEPISALQMLNLENIADNELGLSEDMMAENAGRGIAEVALSALSPSSDGPVVVLAGNNKSGLRAVAAGRHLKNHGLNVVVCVLGIERESELLVGLRRQVKVFRGFGGRVVTKTELFEYTKNLTSPIGLLIDGLLGLTISFEELRTGDQATAYELIEWANRSKAPVLAIDIPTGIEPSSGKVSIIDGRKLYIHAKYVVAMGAPKKGLLEAMVLGEGVEEWRLWVVDMGLGAAVWKKAGTRVRRGVEFEGKWVVEMRFE